MLACLESVVEGNGIEHQTPSLNELVELAKAPDVSVKLSALTCVRKLLIQQKHEPIIERLITAGILPPLVDCLSYDDKRSVQYEAAWALINISAGTSEQTQAVANAGAIPPLIELLKSKKDNIRNQAVWALGNISTDSISLRRRLLRHGIIPPLLALAKTTTPCQLLHNVTWVCRNLLRDPAIRGFSENTYQKNILVVIVKIIESINECSILGNCLWGLSHLVRCGFSECQMVIDSGVLTKSLTFLSHPAVEILKPTIRLFGHIAAGTDLQAQAIVDLGVLRRLNPLMKHPTQEIIRDILWCVSNFSAGTDAQIQEIIDAELIPMAILHLKSGKPLLQKEAAWIFLNYSLHATQKQVGYLLRQRVLEPLRCLLYSDDSQLNQLALDGIRNFFRDFHN